MEVHGPWRLDGLIAVIDWCWSTYVKDTTSSHVEYPPSVAADARQTNATPTPRGGHLSQFSPLHVEITDRRMPCLSPNPMAAMAGPPMTNGYGYGNDNGSLSFEGCYYQPEDGNKMNEHDVM